MRALANRLDEAAQTAARGAGDTEAERDGRMQQRFLWVINDFARQARSFHERMDLYGSQQWDVADEVADLNQRAQRVSAQIRGARAFRGTYQDWAEVTSSLNLMNRSLRGQNVILPANGDRGYQPFDPTYGYTNGRHYEGYGANGATGAQSIWERDGFLTGDSLRDFRRLANSLNVETNRLVFVAEQGSGPGNRENDSMRDLRRFAQRASDLNRSSDGNSLNSRETSVEVGRMMDEARQHQRTMRERSEFPKVEWTATIHLLEQISTRVPRSQVIPVDISEREQKVAVRAEAFRPHAGLSKHGRRLTSGQRRGVGRTGRGGLSSWVGNSGVRAGPKPSRSKTGRISITESSFIGLGQRFTHSIASSIDFTCQSQKPATSSLVSANGPSTTVRFGPEKNTRAAFELG